MKLLKIGEASELLGVPTATLRAWVKARVVPCSNLSPGGRFLFTEDDIEQIRTLLRREAN